MSNNILYPFALAAMMLSSGQSFSWQQVTSLPGINGQRSTGYAGAINGINHDRLIVAGGANFPGKLPWEGGKKAYSNQIHILQRNNDSYVWDNINGITLPEPVAYCGCTSTQKGIVYAGGENGNGLLKTAYVLSLAKYQTVIHRLPDLPVAATNITLTHCGNMVYAAGGDQQNGSLDLFCCIDIGAPHPRWQILHKLPLALANAALVAQNGPDGEYIYLIGGRTKTSTGISDLHSVVYRYNIVRKSWTACANITNNGHVMNYSAGPSIALGKRYILLLGGDDGIIFHQIETLLARINKTTDSIEREQLIAAKNKLVTTHPGFNRRILIYDTMHNSWLAAGELPFTAQVTTNAVWWGNDIVISNGEIHPGVRTPAIMIGSIDLNKE